MAQMFSRSEPD